MKKFKYIDNKEHDEKWVQAVSVFNDGDVEGALFLFKRLADEGCAPALTEIGNIYEHGWGVQRDLDKAIEWYTCAVDLIDDLNAHLGLGRSYFARRLSIADYERARYHFIRLIEEKNHRGALYGLGILYEFGLGVEQSYDYAERYYQLAVEQGHLLALRNMARIAFRRKRYLRGCWLWLRASIKIIRVGGKDLGDPRLGIR